jgi:DNA polymerase-3 subunit delta
MPEITEQTLKDTLKSGAFAPLYLLYGEEDYLKKHYVGELAAKAAGKVLSDFNLRRFEGKETTVDEIISAAEALPMQAPRTCVVVRDMPLDSLSQSEQEKLELLLSDLPDSCVLVFWMDTLEVNPKKNPKWNGIIRKFNQKGCTLPFGRRDTASIVNLLVSGAKKRGCKLEKDVARYLISITGNDLNLLLNELEKACSFAGSGPIKRETLDQTAIKSLEAKAFELVRFLLTGALEKAMGVLDALLSRHTEPNMILGAMISAYVDVYRTKVAVEAGFSAEEAAKYFNYKNKEFRLRGGFRDGAKVSLAQVKRSIELLAAADEGLKGGSRVEGRVLLEMLFMKLVMV